MQELSLYPGKEVDIFVKDKKISISQKKYCLKEMLSQITKDNIHDSEWKDSDIVGLEEW